MSRWDHSGAGRAPGRAVDADGAMLDLGASDLVYGLALLAAWLFCWLWVGLLARARGGSPHWWELAGLLLGPVAVLLAYRMPVDWDAIDRDRIDSGEMRVCPSCHILAPARTTHCRWCRHPFDESRSPSRDTSPAAARST